MPPAKSHKGLVLVLGSLYGSVDSSPRGGHALRPFTGPSELWSREVSQVSLSNFLRREDSKAGRYEVTCPNSWLPRS